MVNRRMTMVLLAIALAWGSTVCAAGSGPVSGKTEGPDTGKAQAAFRGVFDVQKGNLLDRGSNSYMVLEPGFRLVLAHGKDTLTITVLDETELVDGVMTRVVEERETSHGRLEEVSRNFFAFDKDSSDIFYFGEDVDNYGAGGRVKNHEGSWRAGVGGARFGLMMPGHPEPGDRFYQELALGIAMDRAEVVSLAETVEVPSGTYSGCLKTRETSDLEHGAQNKLYAPGIGLLIDEGFKLTRIERDAPGSASTIEIR